MYEWLGVHKIGTPVTNDWLTNSDIVSQYTNHETQTVTI